MLGALETAAKQLGLFQHHDAITGTSKQVVMGDYEERLFFSLQDMYAVIQHLTTAMFWPKDVQHESLVIYGQRKARSMLSNPVQ